MNDFLELSFNQLHQFHLLRPQWFWTLLPLLLVLIAKQRFRTDSNWHQVLPPHLASVLLEQKKSFRSPVVYIVGLFWLLVVFALAGPTWQKIEKPVFQIKRASVILMDMSLSMRATDLKPNRLTKARFKAMDLAEGIGDGEVALVAYAGDAFTISPLTPDARNLTALIPSLTPEIMPETGSYALLGLEQAAQLLTQAGYMQGDIFWFTDGVEQEEMDDLREFVASTPYRVSVLGLGTTQGAPIQQANGALLKDYTGSIVIPKLNSSRLTALSQLTGGIYVANTATDRDVKTLAALTPSSKKAQDQNESLSEDKELTGDDWHEFGPYIVLLSLPLVLFAFRRGVVLSALVTLSFLTTPDKAYANNATEQLPKMPTAEERSLWDRAFKTMDQIGHNEFQAENYVQAQQDFKNGNWKGASAYKAGDHAAALSQFEQDKSSRGYYNQGNALAHLGKLDEAINAYERALELDPNHESAKANKALLEQAKQQQEQQQQQNQDQSEQDNQDGGQQQQSDQQQQQQQQQQNQGQQGQQDQQSQQDSQQDSQQSQQEQSQQQSEQGQSEQEAEPNAQQQEQRQANSEQQDAGEKEAQNESFTPLTPEQIAEQEQQQKIQQLLRKVEDDPATLLRNKLNLEFRKRQQFNRAPKGAKKSW